MTRLGHWFAGRYDDTIDNLKGIWLPQGIAKYTALDQKLMVGVRPGLSHRHCPRL